MVMQFDSAAAILVSGSSPSNLAIADPHSVGISQVGDMTAVEDGVGSIYGVGGSETSC